MTGPLTPPPRKDPQARTQSPLLPPLPRSRAALKFAAAAARGHLCLQHCTVCGQIAWPPRDACPGCLNTALAWRGTPGAGRILARTTVRTTTDPYFRERTPWPVGTVQLDAGPVLMTHLHRDATGRVRVHAFLDKSGNAVMMALPEETTPHMQDDPHLRELTASPRHRRVLITDARTGLGQAVARAVREAGAGEVYLGDATPWLPFDGQDRLGDLGTVLPLDLSDTVSVRTIAGEIAGKTDILINTADHPRPGGVLVQPVETARTAFETGVLGLQRLAQAFGPAMIGRGADGVRSAVAIVDILSVYALANWGPWGMHSAVAAARHSMLQGLRGEVRAGGLRVLAVFCGPIDDAWRQPLPPPKLGPDAVARAVVSALEEGREETYAGDIARDVFARWQDEAKALERELQQ